LTPSIKPNCEAGHYYLVNNYNPGYFGDGKNAYIDTTANNTPFTIPPSNVRNIGIELSDNNISWAYFGDQFNEYLADPYQLNFAPSGNSRDNYCNICNWAQYNSTIMTNPTARTQHLHDTTDLYAAISSGDLPAASWVKPSGFVDGHPASSKLNLFEGFVKKIVDGVTANPALEKNTAIFITFDEGRRILRLRLCAAGRLLWRRHPHPNDRGLPIHPRRAHQSYLHRPRLDLEVH
jgi:phospholipase C